MKTQEITWRREGRTDSLITELPDGTVIRAFWLADRDGIWGDGYGYVAAIPGTKRGVTGKGRLGSLDEVVRDATERVARALSRGRGNHPGPA